MSQSKRWCFTLNNYSSDDERRIKDLADASDVTYLVSGREVASTGTPHLQGFVILDRRRRLSYVRALFPRGVHLECARGTSEQAASYCKKDGDFDEFGTFSTSQGRRNDWDAFKQWCVDAPCLPNCVQIARDFPHLFARYGERMLVIAQANRGTPSLVSDDASTRTWQSTLRDALLLDCDDDRSILFYVDKEGNKGKSWFCRYMMSKHPALVQVLGVGKKTDIAFMIEPQKRIFLIDCDRSSGEFLQYSILEQMKDRIVTSTKYAGTMKVIENLPHVVVFMNQMPDMNALSEDRYVIHEL